MLKSIWKFLNSQFGLLLLGFALTTVIGSFFADWFQRKNWERQATFEAMRQDFEWERSKRFEIIRRKLDDGQAALESISDLINLRFFRLQKAYESIVAKDLKGASNNWKNYMKSVEEWNVKLIINQNKLRRLVNEKISEEFNDYETDDPSLTDPKTIHGKFFIAHKKVRNLLHCLQNPNCKNSGKEIKETNDLLRKLDYQSDEFIDKISEMFIEQTIDTEKFRTLTSTLPSNN